MPTNIGPSGEYPLPDDLIISFERVWKEEISLYPEVPIAWRESEPFKEFAKRIMSRIDVWGKVQEIADQAYEDGYDDGYNKGEEEMKEKVKGMLENL